MPASERRPEEQSSSRRVNAESKALDAGAAAAPFDFEHFFHIHYERIARVIARVVRDPARSEELAVEVFWKLWRKPSAQKGRSLMSRTGMRWMRSRWRMR